MSEGAFAVHRGIFKHPLFEGEAYTRLNAWLWLLGNAAWKPTRVRIGRELVTIQRGQLAHSERFLADKWGWTKSKVHRFLDRLKTEAMVNLEADHETNLITICNYDEYQFGANQNRTTDETKTEPAADQQRTKEEELEEVKKEEIKEESAALRAPPAQADVPRETKPKRTKARIPLSDDWKPDERDLAYAAERGFVAAQIEPMARSFSNHHRAKGSLMADWHAAWRTWCENEIKFSRSGGNGYRGPRSLQDDSLSVGRAAERLATEVRQGNVQFAPRPSLLPRQSQDDLRLLPPGRSTGP